MPLCTECLNVGRTCKDRPVKREDKIGRGKCDRCGTHMRRYKAKAYKTKQPVDCPQYSSGRSLHGAGQFVCKKKDECANFDKRICYSVYVVK